MKEIAIVLGIVVLFAGLVGCAPQGGVPVSTGGTWWPDHPADALPPVPPLPPQTLPYLLNSLPYGYFLVGVDGIRPDPTPTPVPLPGRPV
jgi:hypothetical protein